MDATRANQLASKAALSLMRDLRLSETQIEAWGKSVLDAAIRGQRSAAGESEEKQIETATRWAASRVEDLRLEQPVEEV